LSSSATAGGGAGRWRGDRAHTLSIPSTAPALAPGPWSFTGPGGRPSNGVKGLEDTLSDLEKKRDELAKKAADAAAVVPPAKKYPPPIIPKIPAQEIPLKIQAAAFDSAEARTRIQQFLDRVQGSIVSYASAGVVAGAAAGAPMPASAPPPGPEDVKWQTNVLTYLDRIAVGVEKTSTVPEIDLQAAGGLAGDEPGPSRPPRWLRTS
jgi:hypothetical protein